MHAGVYQITVQKSEGDHTLHRRKLIQQQAYPKQQQEDTTYTVFNIGIIAALFACAFATYPLQGMMFSRLL